MSRLWHSGFELNSTTDGVEWSLNNATPTIQSTTVRTGTYAGQITSLGSGTSKFFLYTYSSGTSNGPIYCRFYLRYATLPSASNAISRFGSASGNFPGIIKLNSDGTLGLYDEDGQVGSNSSALSANTWYQVEYMYDTTAAAGSHVIRARLDGVEFAASTTRSTGGSTAVRFGGNTLSEAQTTGDWFFDDIAINDSSGSQNSYPGAGAIAHLRPDAAGDNSDWSNDYTNVDEVTPDDATTIVQSTTDEAIDDHNIDAASTGGIGASDTINVVAVGARFSSSAASGSPTVKYRIKASSGGTVEESAGITNNGNGTYSTNANSDPRNYPLVLYDLPGASTTAWTAADLDVSQIGYRVDVDNGPGSANVSTVWLSVDFTVAGGGVSKSDSITVSETIGIFTNILYTSATDSVVVTESLTVRLASTVNVSDSITISESVKVLLSGGVNVSDSITLTESVNVTLVVPGSDPNVSDTVTVSESSTSYSDLILTREQYEVTLLSLVSVSESITVTESVNVTLISFGQNINVADSITVSETVSLLLSAFINISDSISVTENRITSLTMSVSVSDSIVVTESTSVVLAYVIGVSDSITVSENVSVEITTNVTVSDSISITELVNILSSSSVNVTESITVSESVQLQLTVSITVSDSISLTESLNLTLLIPGNVTVFDSITVTESVNLFSPLLSITVSENITVTPMARVESIVTEESSRIIFLTDGRLAVKLSKNMYMPL